MHPEVERVLGALRLPQPRQRGIHDRAGGTLDIGQRAALEPRVVERIVVGLVALADAPPRMEHVRRHEARGLVAARQEALGERRDVFAEHEAAVVADGVVRRVEAREDGGVRRQGQRHLRNGVLEHDAFARQARCRNRLERRAVRREVIATQRVDRDDDDIGVGEARSVDWRTPPA